LTNKFDRSLRAYRVLAFKYILEWQNSGPPKLRSTNEALLLTAAGPWFLNGLHSTPDDRSSSRELMTAILPHVNRNEASEFTLAFQPRRSNVREEGEEEEEEDEEDGSESSDSEGPRNPVRTVTARAETIPCNPYGLVFLRSISAGDVPVPRFKRSALFQYMALTEKAWRFFFGKDRGEINEQFLSPLVVNTANPARMPNKVKRTAKRQKLDDSEAILFDLASKGYNIPDPVVDEGSDQEMGSDTEPRNQGPQADVDDNIDSKLSKLWRQFLVDLTVKSPNPRNANAPSYCKLTPEQRLTVDDTVYKNKKLSDYWFDCQWKIATEQNWTLNFNRLWPDKGKVHFGFVQNFPSATYYVHWTRLTSESEQGTVTAMRKELRVMFDLFFWMPDAQSDRIWITKAIPGYMRSSGVDESKPAPRILINWRAKDRPTW
jgi:hypothetical protein